MLDSIWRATSRTAAPIARISLALRPRNGAAVTDIVAPDFDHLPATLQTFLDTAQMAIGPKPHEDEDHGLIGLVGEPLYLAMGPLRTACLLNLFAKARHVSSARCWKRCPATANGAS